MGGVTDGESVSAGVTNPSFLFKNADDSTIYRIGLQKPSGSGPILYTDVQQALNTLDTATGSTQTTPGTTYGAPSNTVNNGDNYQTAVFKLAGKFDPSTGHRHSGAAGDAPLLPYSSVSGTQLSGWWVVGTQLTGVTGGSTNVSTQMSGKTVSSGQTVEGVVVTAPNNISLLKDVNDNDFLDSFGNKVYARITNSGGPSGTWTLTYYSLQSGTETAYSFGSSTTINWFFQQLFSETDRPVYSPITTITSDVVAGEIITATTTQQGKTQLSNTTPPAIASTGSAGTANATVANADHTHAGVTSVNGMQGAVTITTGGGGGGSLNWLEDENSPAATQIYSMEVYNFTPALAQKLWAFIRVPASYTAGNQIRFKTEFFTPDTSNNWGFQVLSYLIRPGVEAINSLVNVNTSNQSGSLSGSVSNSPISMTFNLDDGTGKINSIAIQPGYLILFNIHENGATNTNDLSIPIYASEVTFT